MQSIRRLEGELDIDLRRRKNEELTDLLDQFTATSKVLAARDGFQVLYQNGEAKPFLEPIDQPGWTCASQVDITERLLDMLAKQP